VDYFEEQAYLAQTGQLYGEAAAAALGKVYCFGPTFRAEKSKTRRHLTEFWMCEPEVAWNDSEDNMRCRRSSSRTSSSARWSAADELEAARARHRAAEKRHAAVPAHRLHRRRRCCRRRASEIEWGEDLGAPTRRPRRGLRPPVFVMNYPKEAKAFYMKENPPTRAPCCATTCSRPRATARSSAAASARTTTTGCSPASASRACPRRAYKWYLDLRKYGTFPHSGFGLGLERTVAWITGRPHIREMIPFPRMLNRKRRSPDLLLEPRDGSVAVKHLADFLRLLLHLLEGAPASGQSKPTSATRAWMRCARSSGSRPATS
jgi:asparaginyl-tRNA synthetase